MKRTARLQVCLAAIVVGLWLLPTADACFMRSPQPVQVWLDHVNVEITDQVAVKTYHCTFLNPNPQAVVGGECFMELEPGARVSNMSVLVDGTESQAEILDVAKANKVFTEIVAEGGSPALLEYYGNQLIRTRIPKIAPRGTVTVKLRYTMVLGKKDDLVRLSMLNTNPKASLQTLKSASVRVAIKSQTPIANVYSPTHAVDIVEEPDWDVVVKWSQEQYTPTSPFVLYYQLAEEKIGATLLAHREPGEPGHFMLLLSPAVAGQTAMDDDDVLPKDVVFCVDTSGSMIKDDKMTQARDALRHCLGELRPGDRFNIVDFGTGVRVFSPDALVDHSPAAIERAIAYADKLYPRGGTSIDEALDSSLKLFTENDRLKMILFATDGLPTVGERSPDAILANLAKRNNKDVRLFVFGEGNDVDTKLLDLVAARHRGEAEYVLPSEKIDQKIGRFFDRVGSPIMTDVQIFFDDVAARDVLPRRVPDLFRGEQLIVYGRYETGGVKNVRVRGRVGGEYKTFTYALDFPTTATGDAHAFVPRLWAGEMVDFLLDEMRAAGKEDEELVKEVTFLAKRYGIVTPYTSFLMVEETCNQPLAQQVQNFRGRLGAAGGALGQSYGAAAVTNAWQQSRNRQNRKQSGNAAALYEQVSDALRQEGRATDQHSIATLRYVGNRCFYNAQGRWYDSRYDDTQAKNVQNVVIGSDECLALLKDAPTLAQYMSQGDVVVEHAGNWYRFEPAKRG
ncbi:MAG: VWA domain-containing protein [Planctomycetales bacterium]|nr:VWA domain-containing protein [Planctomycetales bacterium]